MLLATLRPPVVISSHDTPRRRYLAARQAGLTDENALALVAESYGLPLTEMGSAGPDYTRPLKWKLRDFNQLLWLRWMVETDRLSG